DFHVTGVQTCALPILANSSMLVLPSTTTSASRSLRRTVESYGGIHPSSVFDPHVVGTPLVVSTSLRASGTPASGEAGGRPAAMRSEERRVGKEGRSRW